MWKEVRRVTFPSRCDAMRWIAECKCGAVWTAGSRTSGQWAVLRVAPWPSLASNRKLAAWLIAVAGKVKARMGEGGVGGAN